MAENTFAFSHLESPASGAELPEGRHTLRGWVWPKRGGHLVDVRARIGAKIFPGVYGLPRADLAAHFKTGRAFALAEFYVAVWLPPGKVEVVLEALEIEGRWEAFSSAQYSVIGIPSPVDFAVPSGPLRWHEFGRALEMLLRKRRQTGEKSIDELAATIVKSIPYPRDLRHPSLPFHGHLDEPAAVARSRFGRTPVLGYLFHETQPIRQVFATFDLQVWQTIEHRRTSPGPADYFPQFANAQNCALFGMVDIPSQLPSPVSLRLYAELEDGSLHLCPVQQSWLVTNEDEKLPYPIYGDATFPAAVEALRKAMSAVGIEVVNDEAMSAELDRLKTAFRAHAPRAGLSASPRKNQLPSPSRPNSLADKILLVTHNLDLEGAPLFLLDYARHLASLDIKLTVLSPADGPLRKRFEELGARVVIIDATAVFQSANADAARTAIRQVAQQFDFAGFDLVVGNTFTTFWAVHAAKLSARRVLLYIHESTTPANFYHGRMSPDTIALVNEAFTVADAVSFTTVSTRNCHIDYAGTPERLHLTPGWIDVNRIDQWLAANPRTELRARFNLKPGELLITNVGTVSDRKGQHIFARAVDLMWRRYPEIAARCRFIMLGGRETVFDALLKDLLNQINRPNLHIHQETPEYFPYYVAADLFVCSSYEESSPRVILETMACRTPILSPNVHGVPELARPELEATLVPAGDSVAFCEAMVRLLISPQIGKTLAARARARVQSLFDSRHLLPLHAKLAVKTAGVQFSGSEAPETRSSLD